MNIYVGDLSYDVSTEDLRQAFEAYGEVSSANVIRDKYSGPQFYKCVRGL